LEPREAVIKYRLTFTKTPPLPVEGLGELTAWRKILYLLGLVGQHPDRYEGYGYGNVSQRLAPFDAPPGERPFVISASQTGGVPDLTGAHYTLVRVCRPEENRVEAEGPLPPSSECLTHGAVYDAAAEARVVLHVHAPALWRQGALLELPATRAEVSYGSPEMAAEVHRLLREPRARAHRLFVMGGHQDGVVAFGRTAEEAGTVLLQALARAFRLSSPAAGPAPAGTEPGKP
jgi:ribulose-5-phosphate 4-epimerase/fuculose-1-phosphate aldolase